MNLKGDIINLQKCEICEKKFESNDLILIFKCKHLYHSLCVKKKDQINMNVLYVVD